MSIQSGIEAIRRFQVLFNDLAGLATALEGVSELESLAKAHESAAATAKGETDKAKAAKAKADEAVKAAEDKAVEILAKAQEAAEAAEVEARATVAKAQDEGDKLLQSARMKLELLDIEKDAARNELGEIKAQIADAQSALDAVNAEREALRAKLG